MSKLRLFIGRADSDKSSEMYREIISHIDRGEHVYLITPEQSTYVAEKRLSGKSGPGLIGSEVLSVDYLYDRILKQSGNSIPYLSEQGFSMATRRIAEQNADSLVTFSQAVHHQGFCTEISGLFSLLKKSSVNPAALLDISKKLPDGTLLKDKLLDLSVLYAESEKFLETKYLTLDDRAAAAIRLVKGSFLQGSYVFFEDESENSSLFFNLIEEMLACVKEITFSITDDPAGNDPDLFSPARDLEKQLEVIAEKTGSSLEKVFFTSSDGRHPSLRHLERNLFSYPYTPFNGETGLCVSLISAASRQSESDAVCDAVMDDVRGGARFRDIAILVSNYDAYKTVLQRSLKLRNIPHFMDTKKAALSHPAAELVQCALGAVNDSFPASEILRIAKSGYAGITQEESESFENYVLRYNIRKSMFLSEFRFKDDSPQAEQARQKLIVPLLKMREDLHGETVGEKLKALYDYLIGIHLPEQLRISADSLVLMGRPREAMEHAELWKLLMDLFDQLYFILGDTKMSRDDFSAVIREGLSGISIGAIPDTADRILVGDITRTRLSGKIKMIYVMGANDGMLPVPRYDDSIINDSELELLKHNGLPVWTTAAQTTRYDTYGLYCLFCAATDKFAMSYSFSSGEGELRISPIAQRLSDMFPNMQAKTILNSGSLLPSTQRTGLMLLSRLLREASESGSGSDNGSLLLDYYKSDKSTAPIAERMQSFSMSSASEQSLGKPLAQALYGDRTVMSASRLEEFNSCEFKHFLKYGLRSKNRPEATVQPSDNGSLYHAILQGFLSFCEMNGIAVRSVNDEQVAPILEEILPSILDSQKDGLYRTDERIRSGIFLIKETMEQTLKALIRHIKAGKFDPLGTEIRFGAGELFPPIPLELEDGKTLLLEGVIDRVDRAVSTDSELYRVIDYKSSAKKIDYGAVLAGIDLQLPLYLRAVTAVKGIPAAMYFMPVKVDQPSDGQDPKEILARNFRLNGLTLSQPEILSCTDSGLSTSSDIVYNLSMGTKGFRGNICDCTEMTRLMDYSVKSAVDSGNRMFSGGISVNPTEKSCKYCEFRGICRFDSRIRSFRKRKIRKIKDSAEFFGILKGDAHDTVD